MMLLFPAQNSTIQSFAQEASETKLRYISLGGLQGFRADGVDNFNVASDKKRDAVTNNLEDVGDIRHEETGIHSAALDYTAGH